MKRFWKRHWVFIVAIPCFVIALALTAMQSGMIGLNLSSIEEIEHKHREVPADWTMLQTHNKRLAAVLSFDETKEKASFSVYTKRDGFYYGYYTRYTGNAEELGDQVLGLRVLDRKSAPAVALFSLNSRQVAVVEATDAKGEVQKLEVDPASPFALVLMDPQEITLLDAQGNPVELGTMIERSNQIVGDQAPPPAAAPEGEEDSAA